VLVDAAPLAVLYRHLNPPLVSLVEDPANTPIDDAPRAPGSQRQPFAHVVRKGHHNTGGALAGGLCDVLRLTTTRAGAARLLQPSRPSLPVLDHIAGLTHMAQTYLATVGVPAEHLLVEVLAAGGAFA
jgi:hypothetical protein